MEAHHITAFGLWIVALFMAIFINIKARSRFYRIHHYGVDWKLELYLVLTVGVAALGLIIMFYGFDGVLAKVLKFLHSIGMSFPLG